MKRFLYLAALMLLSPSAYAGSSFSFVVGGHRIHIEAPSHCGSPSCVSVSIPGIYQTRNRADGYRDRSHDDAPVVAPPAPVAQPVAVQPAAARPAVPPPPPLVTPAVTPVQASAAPLPASIQPAQTPPVTTAAKTSPTEIPIEAPRPFPEAAPAIARISHQTDDDLADTPLGDWQTEGQKGSVRIEQCGRALCGYVLDPSSDAKGEAVLIGMKPKTASQWSGNIYSRDSGNTYYATIAMKGPNSLQVEACALGWFFCSGNVWSRIDAKPARLITSRQILSQPRS